MTVTAASFVADYPEFANTVMFPATKIAKWLNIASLRLNPDCWCDLLDTGTEFFIAHNLAMDARNALSASKGGVPGQATGIVASKSVGGVSVSYDTGSGSMAGAGQYNLTTYGQQYYALEQIVGAGGIQL